MKKKKYLPPKGFTVVELLLVFLIVYLIIFLVQPYVDQLKEKTNRLLCANNMRDIGKAIYIYASEHNGNFPDSIKTLYEKEYLSDRRLVDNPVTKKIGTVEEPEYIYITGLNIGAPSSDVLLKDVENAHKTKGKHMLQVDGTLKWVEEI